jgi:hypothetical protein
LLLEEQEAHSKNVLSFVLLSGVKEVDIESCKCFGCLKLWEV